MSANYLSSNYFTGCHSDTIDYFLHNQEVDISNVKVDNTIYQEDNLKEILSISDSETRLQVCLEKFFGFKEFRKGQKEIITSVLNGKDTLVLLSTGHGKSLCYQIPALVTPGICVVISPLVSLMLDQVQQLKANGIEAALLKGNLNQEELLSKLEEIKQSKAKFLYIAPERLSDRFCFLLAKHFQVNFIVVDEAHCISGWGHDFRENYLKISIVRKYINAPIMALTATAITYTRQDIIQYLNMHEPFCYTGDFDRKNIFYEVKQLDNKDRDDYLINLLKRQNLPAIVYTNTRFTAEKVAVLLKERGFKADCYHAGMGDLSRETVQTKFLMDKLDIVVATVAFGMGINKSNVRLVFHYDIPRSIEGYHQETGRAGRDGMPAKAVMIYNDKNYAYIKKLIEVNTTSVNAEEESCPANTVKLNKLEEVKNFALANYCRRQTLMHYFSQNYPEPCGHCDLCLKPKLYYNGCIDAQKVLSTIHRTNYASNELTISQILTGIETPLIQNSEYNKLTVFGIGKERSQDYWLNVIKQLVHRGFVERHPYYLNLDFSSKARSFLENKETELQLVKPEIDEAYSKPNDKLFVELNNLRKSLAEMHNVRSDIIYGDPTIYDILDKRPKTLLELSQIEGMSMAKVKAYGSQILSLIRTLG